MSVALLIAGIFAVVAGLLTVAYGFGYREFSVGSTLITSGTIGVCSGMLLVGLYVVLLELQAIGRRLAGAAASEVRVRPVLPPGLAGPNGLGAPAPEPAAAVRGDPQSPPAAPPWQAEVPTPARPRAEAPAEPEAPPPPLPPPSAAPEAPRRRNLLFASSSRKERERAEAKETKAAENPPLQAHAEQAEAAAPETPPASFEDAWPKPDRARPPEPPAARRPPRPSSAFEPAAPVAPPPAPEPPPVEPASVTVLKSGIVDGMAYSLYSDGSIEAQMPEGMMRFASIDELRAHLDQRG
ncbi:DUF308 domain-containing protein [Bradyrhizobium manausense]|uniref:DUF308 domain-containing protein n=1 Tax=Bradyrhizobium manausense TaxID=989370 RepID=UPI001BAC88A2|nr:DUF308 domain-containing protein [Bradyrhizobium manausense]MBR0687924.1 DUF308 domain-containing protein [Bradyrhizobium manausense]